MDQETVSAREQEAFEQYREAIRSGKHSEFDRLTIPIPYDLPLGGVNISGILYLRDPIEDSSTKGLVIGAVNGSYELDRNHTLATFYDPTGALLKVEIRLDFVAHKLEVRICRRTITGGWKCSPWNTIVTW
jgi:hypothetical protein